MQNQIRGVQSDLHHLLTVYSIKIWKKKRKIPPDTPTLGNGLVLLLRVGKSMSSAVVVFCSFQNKCFQILLGISAECQTVWIQIRPNILSDPDQAQHFVGP